MKKPKIKPLTLPAGLDGEAQALIGILQDEFVLVARDGKNKTITKTLSPGAIRTAFNAQPIDSGWLPANVLRYGSSPKGEWMFGWYPPGIYQVYFDGRKRPLPVPMPALCFFGQGSGYYIWALKEKTFVPDALLWNAPLPNVNGIGLICWGTNTHPPVTGKEFPRLWQLFWDAPFTNNWANDKSARHKQNITPLLLELGRAGKRVYPIGDLQPLQHRVLYGQRVTITQMVEMMIKRGGSDD